VSRTSDRRSLATFAALALLVAGLLASLRSSNNEYGRQLYRARLHASKSERTAAVASYRKAARLRPEDPLPYLELTEVYLDWGRWDEARDAVLQAERLGAGMARVERLSVWAHARSAETATAERLAHWKAVVEHGEQLLGLEPEDRAVSRLLARAYLELRQWSRARAVYEDLVLSDPTDEVVRERLGALLLGLGEDAAAVEQLGSAGTELSSQLLGSLGDGLGVDNAAYVHTRLGRILMEHHEWALAARHLERAVQTCPSYADARAYLGHALDKMGYRDEAESHLLKAVGLAPKTPVGYIFLGLHFDRWGDISAARAAYETAYDLQPDSAAVCAEIGQTWAAEGRYVAAEIWLREAVTLGPSDPTLWEALTSFYVNNSVVSDDRGLEAAERLLALAPDSARGHELRGWIAFQAGRYEDAERYLRRAIELDPQLASAYYHLGLLRSEQGKIKEAESAFRRAVDLDTTGSLAPLVERVN